MHGRTIGSAAALLAVGLVAGCSGSGSSSGGAAKGSFVQDGTLTISLAAEPGTLDPTQSLISAAQQINRFTYDGLLNVDASGKLVSGLAEKWEVTPDKLTFTIRKGVTCADGTPMTASVIKDNFEFLKRTKSPLIGTAIPDADYKVTADEAGTFTFTAKSPNGFLLQNIAGIGMVCPNGLKNPKTLARASSGTGPYVISEFVSADHVTVTRRDGYSWGPNGASTSTKGLPKKVIFKIVKNESTSVNLLLAGQVDLAELLGPDRDRVPHTREYLIKDVSRDSLVMNFNQRRAVGGDQAARVALVQALNRDEILKTISSGTGKKASSLISVEPKPCDDDAAGSMLPSYDPEAAKRALDAAGWVVGSDGKRAKNGNPLRVTVTVATPGTTGADAAEVVAQEWKAVGVDVSIKALGAASELQDALFSKFNYDVMFYPLTIQLPSTIYSLLTGPAAPNGTNFIPVNNADYTRLGAKAAVTPGKAGCDLWTQAHAALFRAADLVPMGTLTASFVGRNLQFQFIASFVEPTSLRMLAK